MVLVDAPLYTSTVAHCMTDVYRASTFAPVNIAVIKYVKTFYIRPVLTRPGIGASETRNSIYQRTPSLDRVGHNLKITSGRTDPALPRHLIKHRVLSTACSSLIDLRDPSVLLRSPSDPFVHV